MRRGETERDVWAVTGGQEVPGSNPGSPTRKARSEGLFVSLGFVRLRRYLRIRTPMPGVGGPRSRRVFPILMNSAQRRPNATKISPIRPVFFEVADRMSRRPCPGSDRCSGIGRASRVVRTGACRPTRRALSDAQRIRRARTLETKSSGAAASCHCSAARIASTSCSTKWRSPGEHTATRRSSMSKSVRNR